MFQGANFSQVVVLVLASWLLGGIWYSKAVFGKIWCADEKYKEVKGKRRSFVFGTAFVLWAITAIAFASCVGSNPPFGFAVMIGFLTGTCFVATSFGVNYAFAGRSLKVFLIDAGYHIVQFTLYGAIIGGWHIVFI